MRGRRAGGPAADHEHVKALHGLRLQCAALPGVCPSGQRERAVNPSAQPTEVRILPPPLTHTPWWRRPATAIPWGRVWPRTRPAPATCAEQGRRSPSGALVVGSSSSDVLVAWRHSVPRLFPTSTSTPRSHARSATAGSRSEARRLTSRGSSSRSSRRRFGRLFVDDRVSPDPGRECDCGFAGCDPDLPPGTSAGAFGRLRARLAACGCSSRNWS